MSLPPPIPTSARSGKGIPRWTWPLFIAGPLLLIGEIVIWQKAQELTVDKPVETPMEEWRPASGVPHVRPDEQLSIGADGTFVYRKQTGAERTVRNDPAPVAEPAWLHVPAEAQRSKAEGRRGGGRRQALFQYSLKGNLDDMFTGFGLPLMAEGFHLRRDSRRLTMQFIGTAKQREVFVYGKRAGNITDVTVQITEPDRP